MKSKANASRWSAHFKPAAHLTVTGTLVLLVCAMAPFAIAQPAPVDGTGRAAGYWAAYEASARYMPYTVERCDETGRATGYWAAYEDYCRR